MRNILLFCLSFFYVFGAANVIADDIEIYVGTNELSATQANVLLMVDTSGSMDTVVSGTSETRMQQTKRALKEMLLKLPDNVNVGIGRYNDPGGSILYPSTKLSDTVPQKIVKTISQNDQDAHQSNAGVTNISSTTLDFMEGLKSVQKKVNVSVDDATQCLSGSSFTTNSTTLDINYDGCSNANGTIFRLLSIPKNSRILSATISMRLTFLSSGSTDAEIYAEDASKPRIFSNTAGQRIIDRTYLSSPVRWAPIPSGFFETLITPDVTSLVQRLVNKSDWDTNSGINFMFKAPTGGRLSNTTFYSYDGSSSNAPTINITYIDASTAENKVGLKFDDVQLPSNAQISSAVLKLKAFSSNGSGNITVGMETSNTPSNFTDTTNNISLRTLSSTKINVPFTDWEQDTFNLLDITNLVQEKVNSSGWCGGNAMSFVLNSKDVYKAYSIESGSANAPVLEIKYTSVPTQACAKSLIVNQIVQSNDDGVQRSNSNVYLNNSTLAFSSTYPLGAFLFRKVNLDTKTINNLEIEDAYIEFTSANSTSGTTQFKITAENTANAAALSNVSNSISSKPKTSNSVIWNITTNFVTDGVYRTPNLTTIINEIMSKSGWVKNNNMTFLLERTSGSRTLVANDSSIAKSAKLIIKYKGNGAYNGLTVREDLSNLIDGLNAEGATPLEGALYESGLYFLGSPVDFGRSRHNDSSSYIASKRISDDTTYTGGTHYYPSGCSVDNLSSTKCAEEKIVGSPVYKSPITASSCEVNSIIMITDGYPSYSSSNYSRNVRNDDSVPLSTLINNATRKSCNDPWSCAGNFAQYLYETDFNLNTGGKQNVFTHMIGFSELDSTGQLKDLARKGGGMFIPANNTTELVSALTKIFNNILDVNTTLASPGIAVNQNNKFEHLSEIYYSVFKPSPRQSWYGNLKKYKIDTDKVNIVDANGNEAVDPDTGFFKKGSVSFWSNTTDGDEVTIGGAAEQFEFPKFVFTYTDPDNAPNNAVLNTAKNIITDTNTSLTKSLFNLNGVIDDTDFSTFLKWAKGLDVNDEDGNGNKTEIRKYMGDPLHSRPILLNYNDTKNIIFVSTNEGFLHAIDSESGSEYFSFIPQELLPQLYTHYQDNAGKHIYGLDSSWIGLRHDDDNDGNINSTNDFIYLYGGMRMGGRNYYSLDVSNITKTNPQPKLRWTITPNTKEAFANMGQTWSEPVISKIKLNGKERLVMIVAGGYDPAYEDNEYSALKDTLGNQVYMIDAITGELIWWASSADSTANTKITGMNYSIPSKVTVLDLDNDTYVDKIYVGDMGGQILKFSVDNTATTVNKLVSGKIIATFGVSDFKNTTAANRRKFYESLALTKVKKNEEKYIAIVGGTGYRSRPLNKQINDNLFMIKDSEDYYTSAPATFITPLKLSDLLDVTLMFNKDTLLTQMKTSKGFNISLRETTGTYIGEKILGEAVIYNNKILFNTYIPDGYATRCYPIEGYSRTYQVSLFDGTPANSKNIDNAANQNQTDRYSDTVVPGIAAGSKIIYTDNKVIELVNTKVEELPKGGELGVKKIRWYRQEY